MRLSVEKEQFLKALNSTSHAIAGKNADPILANLKLELNEKGLEIIGTDRGGENDEEGYVEFVAHYAANGQSVEHHEHSYFKKLDGEWKFIDGEIESQEPYVREEPKIGRNDPCPCGSGKKYKYCCGR